MINTLKKFLFKRLSFTNYLALVSKSYFFLYRSGILKLNSFFKYHYFVKNLIKKGDIIIDIGGNLGYFTIPFSKWAGEKGRVYSVEPVKPVREVMERNIGKRKNITVYPYALGNENKEIRMGNNTRHERGLIATGAHFVLEKDAQAVDEFTAEMKKGSELFADLKRLDFIKCDVEGYERVIIPEMKGVIIKHKPLIFIETSGETREFIKNFLISEDYDAFVLEDKKLHSLTKNEDKKQDDILFIPLKRVEEFKKFITD